MNILLRKFKFLNEKQNIKILIIFPIALQFWFFLSGYRQSVDELYFHYYSLLPFKYQIEFVTNFAIKQGRIGHFVMFPINMIASYYSEFILFRIFSVFIFFVSFFLFLKYIEKFLNINLMMPCLCVFFSFLPLVVNILPPQSFPLQITLPVCIFLICKIILINDSNKIVEKNKINYKNILIYFMLFLSVLTSELMFSFVFCLICFEMFFNFVKIRLSRWIFFTLLKSVKKDVLILGFALISYVLFRIVFHSTYNGNIVSRTFDLKQIFSTMWGHVSGGTIFPYVFRSYEFFKNFFNDFYIYDYFFVTIFSLSIFILMYFYFPKIPNFVSRTLSLFSIFSFIAIALPYALTMRFQRLNNTGSFYYVDSRILFFFTVILFVSIVCILRSFFLKSKYYSAYKVVICIFISFCAVITYGYNKSISKKLDSNIVPYVTAHNIACSLSENDLNAPSKIVDPYGRINGRNLDFGLESYWKSYLIYIKKVKHCK